MPPAGIVVASKEVLATGDRGVDFFGERLGIWRADHNSAVFVFGQVDLEWLGAGHVWCPHHDALVKTPKRLARSELDSD